MSQTLLPSEIFEQILRQLLNPIHWIQCMKTCKWWHDIITPIYFDTNFNIFYLENRYIPKCLKDMYKCEKLGGCDMRMITDPNLIYVFFLYELSDFNVTPLYSVKGLYLPFLEFSTKIKPPNSKHRLHTRVSNLSFSYGKFMEHYIFKYPVDDPETFKLIQKISRTTDKKYTEIKINYYEILLEEFNNYYDKIPHERESTKYLQDSHALESYRHYPYVRGSREMGIFRYYFEKNYSKICHFCKKEHMKSL